MIKPELLAPAGNFTKLVTAVYYGADAVYVGGKDLSLRSYSDNFSDEELEKAVGFCHARGKKLYVTLNIYAKNSDFDRICDRLKFLESIDADAVIISDPGVIYLAKKIATKLKIHISTQANTLNKYSAKFWADQGASRIILARELSLREIAEIRDYLPDDVELEAFCHGAMCISYSGRCLLSDYFANRSSNRGECVQACRWNYSLRERNSDGEWYDITEDTNGSYILNSKDLNMISELDSMVGAGICSFKIEGRMKSEYYLATVVNAYRRAFDSLYINGTDYKKDGLFEKELLKTNHRTFTKAYAFEKRDDTVNYADSQSVGERTFTALVLDYDEVKKTALIEMRNRFAVGDELELLTPYDNLNEKITVTELTDTDKNAVSDAKIVQQKLYLKTDVILHAGDILRK